MSAIGGLVRLGARPATEAEVSRALAAMRRRGPKERRTWTDGTAALGHASLGTCGAGAAQPLADPASGRIIVFDGRIDEGAALALQAHACWGERIWGGNRDTLFP